jgi:outer membrane receptor protein involved in Fe transport
VELMLMSDSRSQAGPRPFLALAAGLYRNRVQGFINNFEEDHDESVNSLGVSFRGGVQVLGFELSLVYHVNRFNTWAFHQSAYRSATTGTVWACAWAGSCL